ncbi:uncharacterized protein MYCFIDRAFT_80791 [Pseudocercospora fijiensis CIRAD86]|uniref:Uncharacterized protein n=1 Tax=Pseudocercospora fijiensis (strain CIRAD86) TaxID=383855 RepID=M3AMM5_PSEFD|nr:uncharacterized protein MYCFIDRAFT_80791 [Pseudocercospora fijiensis CIRAD86]EME78373.1 hypothetical protein MYCFIDRAFT_80791 [Pseudocercospora fijiensis CIRAD86]
MYYFAPRPNGAFIEDWEQPTFDEGPHSPPIRNRLRPHSRSRRTHPSGASLRVGFAQQQYDDSDPFNGNGFSSTRDRPPTPYFIDAQHSRPSSRSTNAFWPSPALSGDASSLALLLDPSKIVGTDTTLHAPSHPLALAQHLDPQHHSCQAQLCPTRTPATTLQIFQAAPTRHVARKGDQLSRPGRYLPIYSSRVAEAAAAAAAEVVIEVRVATQKTVPALATTLLIKVVVVVRAVIVIVSTPRTKPFVDQQTSVIEIFGQMDSAGRGGMRFRIISRRMMEMRRRDGVE